MIEQAKKVDEVLAQPEYPTFKFDSLYELLEFTRPAPSILNKQSIKKSGWKPFEFIFDDSVNMRGS
jgi:hypothetical protein